MKRKQPEEKYIGDVLCYSKEKACRYMGMGMSCLNDIILRTKAGAERRNPLKFFQKGKGSPIWIPKGEIDAYIINNINQKARNG